MFKTVTKQNTRDLISEFVKTDFTLKYNNSILGFLWVLLKPLVMFLILFIITSRVFPNNGIKFYPLYLLMGTIMLSYWNEGTSFGMKALLDKANLILKVNFPRYIAIVSSVLLPLINFLINLVIFILIELIFFRTVPSIGGIALFLFALITMFLIILDFSLFTSIIYARLRDLGSIWELVLNLMFWITPVVYTLDTIKGKSDIIGFAVEYLNPVSVVLQATRTGLIPDSGQSFNIWGLVVWFFVSIFLLITGYYYFRQRVPRIAESI